MIKLNRLNKVILTITLFFTYSAFAKDGNKFTKQEIIKRILSSQPYSIKQKGIGRAPVNIALCKYWGKRNEELNLPYTSSLSLALPYYTVTTISIKENNDQVFLNDKEMPTNSEFRKRTIEFLNLFRSTSNMYFKVETHNDLPTASGFASSASGFAALVIALDDLFNWNLASEHLSILARLGSGSASRSIYPGFVYWEAGIKSDGTDSYAKALSIKQWDNLRVGLLVINEEKKDTSSRDAMKMAVNTSPYYSTWIKKVNKDLEQIKSAIISHDIQKTGEIAEHNALSMHATTITSCPPLLYWTSQTVSMIEKVWMLRQKYNKNVYFTIDAGPNLILLFEKNDEEIVKKTFPKIRIITPLFGSISNNGN